ncbi:hypothetical protein [Nocardioides pinisoli]|uniref:Uncharacterized protein n=1 Tax=Nocardioides pinisoli TaxID=2950279 RepID=A0ABT1KRF9_9ACTN|nr:hypothetical protein [Nocardioides pinisoli]MCP3420331.1 hypothetical protein [Nocardioides pinisoli]
MSAASLLRFPPQAGGLGLEGQMLTLWQRPGRYAETFRTPAGERVQVQLWTSTGRGERVQGRPDPACLTITVLGARRRVIFRGTETYGPAAYERAARDGSKALSDYLNNH